MKKCTKCNQEKAYSEFYKNKKALDGYQYLCKVCTANRYNDYNSNYGKDGLHHVYVSDKYNYAGTTCMPEIRKRRHKYQGRPDIDMRIIYSTPNREDALELEELLHDLGYEGRGKGFYR